MRTPPLSLPGKVAVVTGASSGIGAATVRALSARGVHVVAVARRAERLAELAEAHPGVVAHTADVTDDAAVADLAERVRAELGACHVLVNNAGAVIGRRLRGPDDVEDVRRSLDLNVLGAVRCMAALADLLVASAPARVVNVASVAGKLAVPRPGYAASKFALVGLTEAVSGDWARRGVAVSQLNPGFVATEGFPQQRLLRSRLGRGLLVDVDQVAEALVTVARRGTPERTVPRWYRPAVVARHVAPPLTRRALRQR